VASNPLPPGARKSGTVGAATNVDVAIMGDDGALSQVGAQGEVVVRGETVMHGYYHNPEANRAAFTNGWFRTGDLGVFDSDGYLRITGRIKELINRGGEKISPMEVDAVLLSNPAVAEAASFGVPDSIYGEEIQAAVTLRADVAAAELQAYCRSRLADFKVPKVIHFVKELPRDPTGKVERFRLTRLFST
jgi:acyl-CoA synthetase (AMP-forming)/AMP-acid ligase II